MSEELEFTLGQLQDASKPVRKIGLEALSDLTGDSLAQFRQVWAGLEPERRLELIQELVDQAEANVRLDFGAILRDRLADADARVRRLAVEGLWEDSRPNLVPALMGLLAEDPAPEVRAAAAVSLGRFVLQGELGEIPEPVASQAADALRGAWLRPREVTEVRRRALEGIAYLGGPAVGEMIQSAYYDEDDLMRQSAVFAMGRSAERRWAKAVLAELESHKAAMRFEAAAAAGELALTGAVRPLAQLLEDADSAVREAAALALGQIGGPEARRALESAVAGDDERLAQAAEEALEELTFNSDTPQNPLFDLSAVGDGELPAEDGDEDDELVELVDVDELYADDESAEFDEDGEGDWSDDDEDDEEDWLDEDEDEEEDWQ